MEIKCNSQTKQQYIDSELKFLDIEGFSQGFK